MPTVVNKQYGFLSAEDHTFYSLGTNPKPVVIIIIIIIIACFASLSIFNYLYLTSTVCACGGARDIMVIDLGNGHDNTSSNPG